MIEKAQNLLSRLNLGATRIVLICAIAVFASGCTYSRIKPIKANEIIDRRKGVLLAAVTSDGHFAIKDAWYFFRKKGTEEELRLDAFGLGGLFIKPDDYPDQKTIDGRLLAVILEPGDYELIGWMLYVSRAGGYGYISPKSPPQPFPFTISSANITYLGNLHIDTVLAKNFFGIKIPAGGIPRISDNLEVDALLMKKKYPKLVDWPIRTSIPNKDFVRRWQLSVGTEDTAERN